MGHDLGVDTDLADAARDQLRVLRAEVDDQDDIALLVGPVGVGHRQSRMTFDAASPRRR